MMILIIIIIIIILMILMIRSELKLKEGTVTNLQDQLSNAGQTPGRRQSAVGLHKAASEVIKLICDWLTPC